MTPRKMAPAPVPRRRWHRCSRLKASYWSLFLADRFLKRRGLEASVVGCVFTGVYVNVCGYN